jgi:hypothetical protein
VSSSHCRVRCDVQRAAEAAVVAAAAAAVSAHSATVGAATSPSGAAAVDISKYVKLVQLGQPLEHVKMKMKADGVDPALLDGRR